MSERSEQVKEYIVSVLREDERFVVEMKDYGCGEVIGHDTFLEPGEYRPGQDDSFWAHTTRDFLCRTAGAKVWEHGNAINVQFYFSRREFLRALKLAQDIQGPAEAERGIER